MGATLRVDPSRLLEAARAQADVGRFISDMGTGQSMAAAGSCMSGWQGEAACHFVGSIFDAAASAVHDELQTHSVNLTEAADRYHRTDEELGHRLREFAPCR